MSRFYITTAIDFVNSRPHLGTAYEKIAADVIARYHRLRGADTWFLMGNDEHSQNVFKKAGEMKLDPLAYCDRMETEFRDTWRALDLSFDDFIRTTQPRHHAGVVEMTRRIFDAGDIFEGVYEGWYCVGCEAFKQEKDLVEGRCPLHPATTPQWIREKNHFFRLSKYQRPLLDHFAASPGFLEPEVRRNEILRLLEAGLDDISISRAGQSWGIPLPFDPSGVVYVWFDALINYASAVGLGGTTETERQRFQHWWPADLHVIGKDITRFHTVIWPAMLMSAKLPLPARVFGHGFMSVDGQRMSKSLGNLIDPAEAAARFGPDPLRLYLVKEVPFGGDGDFSWERYDARYNVDLANNLGNLVSRVTAMAGRYRQGRLLPTAGPSSRLAGVADSALERYRKSMDALAIHDGAAAAFALIDATNEFIAATEPWRLAKDPGQADALTQALFDMAEAIRIAAVLLAPVMPASSAEILRRVGAPAPSTLERDGRWRNEGERVLAEAGALWPRTDSPSARQDHGSREKTKRKETIVSETIPPGAPVPPKDDGEIRLKPDPTSDQAGEIRLKPDPTSAPGPTSAATKSAGLMSSTGDRISIDDFMKVELRVAKVLAAERVPKSSRLLKLLVDAGTEQRTIVAGIAEAYEPESLIGRTVAIVFNLKPAKLMGVESNGMVLAASPEGGKPTLVSFVDPPEPGTRVR